MAVPRIRITRYAGPGSLEAFASGLKKPVAPGPIYGTRSARCTLTQSGYCEGGYCGADCGLRMGRCPGGRLGVAELPPILKFLSASDTIGFDPAGAAPVGDSVESSDGWEKSALTGLDSITVQAPPVFWRS